MNDLSIYKDYLYLKKHVCVKHMQYEYATNWRDAERELIKVIDGNSTLKLFIQHIKGSNYENYDEIYEVVKPLDIMLQRREKIIKIKNKME